MIKKFFEKVNVGDVVLFLLALTAAAIVVVMIGGGDGVDLATAVATGFAGGKHVVDGPLTTAIAGEVSPGLLRNEIDSRVVRIRPMSTPIDQISRCGGCRPCGSMKVEYYSVDTKPSGIKVSLSKSEQTGQVGTDEVVRLTGADIRHVAESETVLFPSIVNKAGEALVGYVVAKDNDGTVSVKLVNGDKSLSDIVADGFAGEVEMVRMGRAATELDVQTAQFEAIPTKADNLCQIFKAQVEQSTYQKIANKETGWTFSDQEEVAIMDMRLGMEKSFLFGKKARFAHPLKNEEVLMTGGIWSQAGNEFEYYSDESLDTQRVVAMMKRAFTGNGGSSRKILVAGSGLIERLNNLEYTRMLDGSATITRWGIDFNELRSKFGTLYVVHSEVFDTCGHADDGLIIDPEYITKYSHVPFRTETLDLKKSGVRNTEAVVITEASCLVLRYPQAHTRVVAV